MRYWRSALRLAFVKLPAFPFSFPELSCAPSRYCRRSDEAVPMPQTFAQWLRGYISLTIDTLGQRIFDHSPPHNHPLFTPGATPLTSHVSIITGANTGIGFQTARSLAASGATVVLACRNPIKAATAATSIRSEIPGASVETATLDLSDLQSVRAFANEFSARVVDSLILNGGVMGVPRSDPETHLSVNHVAHALLTLLLLPSLARSAIARVVFVSSLTARISDLWLDDLSFAQRKYSWMTAYSNSKLCMLLFSRALAIRLAGTNIHVNAVHPGEAPSDVARHLSSFSVFVHKRIIGPCFLISCAESARTSVYAAAADEVLSSGSFFYRTHRVLTVPDHLTSVQDVEKVWTLTLQMAGMTEADLSGLHSLQATAKTNNIT